MFVPKPKRTYTNNLSDLKIIVSKVRHVNIEKDYIKFFGYLVNKNNGIIYEKKNFKLKLSNIQDWEECR